VLRKVLRKNRKARWLNNGWSEDLLRRRGAPVTKKDTPVTKEGAPDQTPASLQLLRELLEILHVFRCLLRLFVPSSGI